MGAATYPSLRGKVVLVTGGGGGIGAALVEAFAAQGSRVAFLDVAVGPSEAVAEGTGATFVRCDLRDVGAIRAAVAAVEESLGPVDVLVNNAGWDERHAIGDVTPELWDEVQAVNLRPYFFTAQAVATSMKARGGGAIVNLGSTSWKLAIGGMPGYTAAKAGIEGLSRGLARDLGGDGIRVNCVLPGWVMTERQLQKWVTPEALAETKRRQILPIELRPEDVAPIVLFLASDQARAISGQSWHVDGGIT